MRQIKKDQDSQAYDREPGKVSSDDIRLVHSNRFIIWA